MKTLVAFFTTLPERAEVVAAADICSDSPEYIAGMYLSLLRHLLPHWKTGYAADSRDILRQFPEPVIAAMQQSGLVALDGQNVLLPLASPLLEKMRQKLASGRERTRRYRRSNARARHCVTRVRVTRREEGGVREDSANNEAGSGVQSDIVLLVFPTAGQPRQWELTESLARELSDAFPNVDILAEAKKALAWIKANHCKTAKGMRRFLTGWLSRAVNGGRYARHASFTGSDSLEEKLQRARKCQRQFDFGINGSFGTPTSSG